jgi:hypothetical protein
MQVIEIWRGNRVLIAFSILRLWRNQDFIMENEHMITSRALLRLKHSDSIAAGTIEVTCGFTADCWSGVECIADIEHTRLARTGPRS